MTIMIQLDGISHRYTIGIEKIHALKNVNLHIEAGERVALVGNSGCGKSTLFHIIGGMLTPCEGRVLVDGKPLHGLVDNARSDARNQTVGFVFQLFHLLPYYSAARNVELPLVIAGVEPEERKARAYAALDHVGLKARAEHRPSQLSGGEMQRVSIARALVSNPKLILADEPTGNLDRTASDHVVDLLLGMSEEMGITVVLTTHQEAVMQRFARIVRLDKGEVIDA